MNYFLKRLGLVVTSCVGFLLVLLFIIPYIFKIDYYRPQLTQILNDSIHGRVELGELSLSLFGRFRVEIAGVKLSSLEGKEVFSVKNAYLHFPLLSILSGSPQLILKMSTPYLNVVKDKYGFINFLNLIKKNKKAIQSGPSLSASSQISDSSDTLVLPAIVAKARLGLELEKTKISYLDEKSGLKMQVKDFNFIIQNMSFSYPSEFQLWADINTHINSSFNVQGPARMQGSLVPFLDSDGKIGSISLSAQVNLNELEVLVAGIKLKTKKQIAQSSLKLVASEKEVKIESLNIQVLNAEINSSGVVANFVQQDKAPIVHYKIQSNEIDLKTWVPQWVSSGLVHLDTEIHGSIDQLKYHGKILFSGFVPKLIPQLKIQPTMDVGVYFSTNQIESMDLALKAPGSELSIQGKLVSFSKPNIDFNIVSSKLDLDRLINFSYFSSTPNTVLSHQSSSMTQSMGQQGASRLSGSSSAKKSWLTKAQLDWLNQMNLRLSLHLKSFRFYQTQLENLQCLFRLNRLILDLDNFHVKVFSGDIGAKAQVQLKSDLPVYQFDLKMSRLDLVNAFLTGKISLQTTGSGLGLDFESALAHLKTSGSFKIDQPVFLMVDAMKVFKEGVFNSWEKLQEKIPVLKGKNLPSLPFSEIKYEQISSDFSIRDGVFLIPNFFAKAIHNQGFDLKGEADIQLRQYLLRSSWKLIDTYNLTRLQDLSVEKGGVTIEHILAEPHMPILFPFRVGCSCFNPCYEYSEIPEHFLKVILANFSNGINAHAKEEAKKKLENVIQQVLPTDIQGKLKGLFR